MAITFKKESMFHSGGLFRDSMARPSLFFATRRVVKRLEGISSRIVPVRCGGERSERDLLM